jgi:hypothetical protein
MLPGGTAFNYCIWQSPGASIGETRGLMLVYSILAEDDAMKFVQASGLIADAGRTAEQALLHDYHVADLTIGF